MGLPARERLCRNRAGPCDYDRRADASELRPELAPQTPAYLALPTALFDAGLQDLDSLHRRLGEIRDDQLVEGPEDGEVFIRGYGDALDTTTPIEASQTSGSIRRRTTARPEFGANWIARNGPDGTLRAGLAGTARPALVSTACDRRREQRAVRHRERGRRADLAVDRGWYVDGLVAGGLFNGNGLDRDQRPGAQHQWDILGGVARSRLSDRARLAGTGPRTPAPARRPEPRFRAGRPTSTASTSISEIWPGRVPRWRAARQAVRLVRRRALHRLSQGQRDHGTRRRR